MIRKIFLNIIFSLIGSMACFAQYIGIEADSAYQAGDYAKAIVLYEQLENEQGISPALLYNLGNCYYQASDFANAMICYERAYKLKPSDKRIRHNLNFLRSKIEDANRGEQRGKKVSVAEDEPTFFQTVHSAIAVEIASDRWAIWGVVAFFLFLTCAGVYIFTTNVIFRKIGFFGGFVLIGVTIICIIFSCLGASAFNNREAGIITAYKTELQTEPGQKPSDKQNNILTRGTKVRVIAEETDAEGNVSWYKIRLNSEYIGWVKADELTII